jgi:hypothetical protein
VLVRCGATAPVAEPGRRSPCPTTIRDIGASAGSVLLSSVQICVICGNFGCNEAQIEKESRHAQFEARPESYPQRCAHNIEKLHRSI